MMITKPKKPGKKSLNIRKCQRCGIIALNLYWYKNVGFICRKCKNEYLERKSKINKKVWQVSH